MHAKKHGFLAWLGWSFFSWKGSSSRKSFAGAALCGMIAAAAYTLLIYYLYIQLFPLHEGHALTVKFLIDTKGAGIIPSWAFILTPLVAVFLGVKRLRNIGLSPLIGVAVPAVDSLLPFLFAFLSQQGFAGVAGPMATGWGWLTMLYFFVLLLAPSRAAVGPRSKTERWAALRADGEATGNAGTHGPYRIQGKILGWRAK